MPKIAELDLEQFSEDMQALVKHFRRVSNPEMILECEAYGRIDMGVSLAVLAYRIAHLSLLVKEMIKESTYQDAQDIMLSLDDVKSALS